MQFSYSPTENQFLMNSFKEVYQINGTWPIDALPVDDALAIEFMGEAPAGKVRSAGADNLPCWVDITEPAA